MVLVAGAAASVGVGAGAAAVRAVVAGAAVGGVVAYILAQAINLYFIAMLFHTMLRFRPFSRNMI